MATPKQLAALKKARAARAKNTKKKTPVKRVTKTTRKKAPVKRAVTKAKYVIYTTHNRKRWYFDGAKLNDDISEAKEYDSIRETNIAIEIASCYGGNFNYLKK